MEQHLNYFFLTLAKMKAKFDKVLLIDDDKINNYLVQEVISSINIAAEIIVLTDGEKALNYLSDYTATNNEREEVLILLDLNMPVMDGFEFLEEFEAMKIPADFMIVVLTSSDNQRDKDNIKRHHISQYISKPITEEKLLQLLA